MKEVIEAEVEVEVTVEDRLEVAIVYEVQISSTIVTRNEKAQENVEKAIQAQGMINLKLDGINVKRLATMLLNVDSPRIELRRRLTMWSKRMRSFK